MTPLPTLIVHGRHGDWTATVDSYGDVYCCHEMFLTGKRYDQNLTDQPYDQDCTGSSLKNRIKKKRQMEALREQGLVIITHDQWDRPPGDPGPGGRYRRSPWGNPYVGLFQAHDADYRGCHLLFRRGDQIAFLVRPCDL